MHLSDRTYEDAFDDLLTLIRGVGKTIEEEPRGFAVDFNNAILADPYLEGTGFFPDQETAKGFASLVIPILSAIADEALREKPDLGVGWSHPEAETNAWCYIISAERKGWDGDPNDGDPVVEEMFEGDAWFLAGVALGQPFLSAEEQATLDKVRATIEESAK